MYHLILTPKKRHTILGLKKFDDVSATVYAQIPWLAKCLSKTPIKYCYYDSEV